MSDWTPHADAVVRAVPEDEATRAVQDALEKRYRALIERLREAGDEVWANSLAVYNSYRSEPARCSLAVLEMMAEEIHSLRQRGVAASMRLNTIKKLHQPTTIPERRDLVCKGRHGIWMHWPCMEARALGAQEGDSGYVDGDWQQLADNWQWSAQQVRSERNQLKEVNDRMAIDRERLIAERDEARQDRDEWKALHGSAVHEMQARLDRQERAHADLRRAYEHVCAERDTYRDLAKALYDDEPCSFDHHGGCQSHMFLEPEPGETCPDGRAQRLFEGGDNDADGD